MRRDVTVFAVASLLAFTSVAACGDSADAEPEPVVIPSGPPARDSMSAESLVGIAPEEIALALPWSSGTLNRGAQEGQAQRTIEEILLLSGEGFDRFVVTFRDDAPQLPGYRVRFVDTVADCAADPSEVSFTTEGTAFLELHLTAANARRDDGTSAIPSRELGGVSDHVLGLITTCDFEGQITWVFDLAEATSYRLLELRDPTRLVVDVQKPMGASPGA